MPAFRKSLLHLLLTAGCLAGCAATAADNFAYTPPERQALSQWSHSLAVQAATWGAPLVTMYALRHNDATGLHPKAAPNTLWRMEDISTPALSKEAGYVTPNVNTIYGFGFLDLRQEPVIIDAPNSNGLYYMIEIVDMWTNAFAYIGGKTTGYAGGKFALVAPDWKGTLPDGVTRIDSPTPWVLIQPRVHVYKDKHLDVQLARSVLQNIKVIGLGDFTGKKSPPAPRYDYTAPDPVNPAMPVSDVLYKDPLQFWQILSAAMNENPPPADQVKTLMPLFKSLGIELGKKWDPATMPSEVVDSMKKVSVEIDPMIANLPSGNFYNGAFIPPPSIGNAGADFRTRAIVARLGLTANIPNEAIYWLYKVDNHGKLLSGANKYTLTYAKEIPFVQPGFWSVTMYDSSNNYTIENPIHRYMLGSDSELIKNTDGSITLYIQKESPGKDREANWLPAPAGEFYLIPRVYAPPDNLIDVLERDNGPLVPPVVQVM